MYVYVYICILQIKVQVYGVGRDKLKFHFVQKSSRATPKYS